MDGFETALQLLPARWIDPCRRYGAQAAEELRMRVDRPLMLLIRGKELSLPGEPVTEAELMRTLEKATGASLHTAAAEVAEGYVNYRGLRIGLCGVAVRQNGGTKGFRHYSSLAVRIPHDCLGCCDEVMAEMYALGYQNTLILSKPGGGKTTALREMTRKLSQSGTRVGVVDERNELAAYDGLRAGFDLGAHSDVLVGITKAEGAMMLLRAMNPEILCMDEITRPEDISAIGEICGCGVGLLASAHAADVDELRQRPLYRKLLSLGVFRYALVINRRDGQREYKIRSLQA